ncbi:hypothetical protein [Roseomonas sp. KE0001]|uniref:hypothetical protein n=1 Tax=Roseomonas sp. KE0001 TaxID=2479201 RepID=UPI0018DFEC46|nr:hypothetical protein [Roseomonas sp. KE0001]MBI0432980.1 hypothetical protein [Roseomonas sp. KE0001]
MTFTIAITSMDVFSTPQQTGGGTIYARLNLQLGPLLIIGARLTKIERGEVVLWLPRFNRDQRILCIDPDIRQRSRTAAIEAYRALTGRDPADTPLATASFVDNNHDPSRDAGAPRGHRC